MSFVRKYVASWMVAATTIAGGCAEDLPVANNGDTSSGSGQGDSPDGTTPTGPFDTASNGTEDNGTEDDGTEDNGADPDPWCGNGIVEAGEYCDDGAESAACNFDCTPAVCGDGLLNESSGEQCDGAGRSDDCNSDCTLSLCGDGALNIEAGEECDHAGESATCDEDCTAAQCGDLHVNTLAGEGCEGEDFADSTCEELGFDTGTLFCGVGCSVDTSECYMFPSAPTLELSASQTKQFDFSWASSAEAEYYQLFESPSPGEPLAQLGGDIVGNAISVEMALHFRHNASYVLNACNGGSCTPSDEVSVAGSLAEAVGYFKASNNGSSDDFGYSVALSGDGNTLAIGATGEDSDATGINGDQNNNNSVTSGAVYVFARDSMGGWSQQAYVKASNTESSDQFGYSVTLSGDGNTLVIGAIGEDSISTGINNDQTNNNTNSSGAAYVFVRDGMGGWSQQAYIKASNTGSSDQFGYRAALSGDGNTVAISAISEDSHAIGVNSDQLSNTGSSSGAVYVFVHDGMGGWSQQAYVKSFNTDTNDNFGYSVTLGDNGNTLAIGAIGEDSESTGVDNDHTNNNAGGSGAVYVFVRDGVDEWSQQAYIKASNTGSTDQFGYSVALSGDNNTLVIGAISEDSYATDIGGDQENNAGSNSGAVYVFVRDGMNVWSQQVYLKASNTGPSDQFGYSVALSEDGNALAVGANVEDSNAIGIDSDQGNNNAGSSGAVYVFMRDGMDAWSQQAYLKAPNTGPSDQFGHKVAISGNGSVVAAGAAGEDSYAVGINGNQSDNTSSSSGAVYLY